MTRTEKQNIFLWALYDFANSFIYIAFFLYFSQWIVIDRHIPDAWFNMCFVFSSLVLLFTAPYIGSMLDKTWRNISGLRLTSSAIIFFYALAAVSALKNLDVPALIFFAVGLYFFTLSFTFYTPLLSKLCAPEKRGVVSGWGMTGNFIGNISALFLVLPFVEGKIYFFSGAGRAGALLPAIIAFFLFSLPMMIFFKEPRKISPSDLRENHWRETKKLFSYSSVLIFLVAFVFLNGAILTVINNFPIVLDSLWGASDSLKTALLLGIIVASVFGGIIGGWLADRFGSKKTLIWIALFWTIMLTLLALAHDFSQFITTAIVIGFLLGASFAVARVFMSHLAPSNRSNLAFAYFNVIERASALVAPLVWGLAVSGFMGLGSVRYRLALVSMAILIGLSLPFLTKIKLPDAPY